MDILFVVLLYKYKKDTVHLLTIGKLRSTVSLKGLNCVLIAELYFYLNINMVELRVVIIMLIPIMKYVAVTTVNR